MEAVALAADAEATENLDLGDAKTRIERRNSQISATLEKSKEEGKKRRRRITYTSITSGAFGFIVGALVCRAPFIFDLTEDAETHPLFFIGFGIIFGSFSILLLGVLPSDRNAIRVANGLVALIVAFCGITSGLVMYEWATYEEQGIAGESKREDEVRRAYWLFGIFAGTPGHAQTWGCNIGR